MANRMLLLLLSHSLLLSLLFQQSSASVTNNLEFRLNSVGQIEAGRDSNQCLSIKADFTSNFRLRKKSDEGSIQVFTETCAYKSSQLFRQIDIDETTETKIAICLDKYFRLYRKDDTIRNSFYCLYINNKGLLRVSAKLKNYADVVSKTELHWSINNLQDDGFCEFFDTKNNYLFMNKKGKIRALPEDQIIKFRTLSDVPKIGQGGSFLGRVVPKNTNIEPKKIPFKKLPILDPAGVWPCTL